MSVSKFFRYTLLIESTVATNLNILKLNQSGNRSEIAMYLKKSCLEDLQLFTVFFYTIAKSEKF
jgi:hypothetical protein